MKERVPVRFIPIFCRSMAKIAWSNPFKTPDTIQDSSDHGRNMPADIGIVGHNMISKFSGLRSLDSVDMAHEALMLIML